MKEVTIGTYKKFSKRELYEEIERQKGKVELLKDVIRAISKLRKQAMQRLSLIDHLEV